MPHDRVFLVLAWILLWAFDVGIVLTVDRSWKDQRAESRTALGDSRWSLRIEGKKERA